MKYTPKWFWTEYWDKGRSLTDLAEEAGKSVGTISNWFKQWGFPTRGQGTRTPAITNLKLTDEDIKALKKRADEGESKTALALEYGISRQRLYTILQGKHRRLE